jgi:tetratricopeptide (TPR) repeat protein
MPSMTQSIEKLQKKLVKDPNSLIFLQLAEEQRKEGKLEDALQVLKEGLIRHPNYWSARVAMGRIYHQVGDMESAQAHLEKVIQNVPDNMLANRILGDIYAAQHHPDLALKRYRVVQMLTPGDKQVALIIKRLEAETRTPEPEPDTLALAEPKAEVMSPVAVGSEAKEEPEVSILPATPAEPAAEEPAEQKTVAAAEPEQKEEALYPPTIQVQIPEFLDKTEVPIRAVEEPPTEHIRPSEAESIHAGPFPEAANNVEEEARLSESSEEQNQLSNLANLLLTPEPEVEEVDFGDLDTELKGVEHLISEGSSGVPHQDRTQPIDEEEEEHVDEADELTSETLAELYLNQGLIDKAVKVYQKLLLNDPNNLGILKRLRELAQVDSLPQVEESHVDEQMPFVHVAVEERKGIDDISRRAELKKRKIATLENWLATLHRDQH